MGIEIWFDIQNALAVLGATAGLGGFLFTLRNRHYYLWPSRTSLLIGGLASFLPIYFQTDAGNQIATEAGLAFEVIAIQSAFSISVIMFSIIVVQYRHSQYGKDGSKCGEKRLGKSLKKKNT